MPASFLWRGSADAGHRVLSLVFARSNRHDSCGSNPSIFTISWRTVQEVAQPVARRDGAPDPGDAAESSIETPFATVTVFGNRWDFECYDLRDFLTRNHVAFHWVDSDDAATAENGLRFPTTCVRKGRFPVVRLFADGSYAVAPTFRDLAERLGLQTRPSDTVYDLAIVGAGPAGLARRSTARRRGCGRCSSSAGRRAVRPARRRASKTISASPAGLLRRRAG